MLKSIISYCITVDLFIAEMPSLNWEPLPHIVMYVPDIHIHQNTEHEPLPQAICTSFDRNECVFSSSVLNPGVPRDFLWSSGFKTYRFNTAYWRSEFSPRTFSYSHVCFYQMLQNLSRRMNRQKILIIKLRCFSYHF
jgi:hypothetical protein